MRFFFMGPRILGIRPGISVGPGDFRRAFGATRSTAPGRGATASMTGSFVYVIGGQAGHHKIGVSRDPVQRLAALQTGSPVPLRFAYVGVTPGTGYDIESTAHELLAAHRQSGEWFLVPASIAIGAALEAASRLGEPIQQVRPEHVPEIIRLASRPDPRAPEGRPSADITIGLPFWLRWPIKIVAVLLWCAFVLFVCLVIRGMG